MSIVDWAQVFATLFVGGTLIVAFLGLRSARQSAKAQSLIGLIDFLQEEDRREARDIVRNTLRKRPYEDWDVGQRAAASNVCATYDIAGILIRYKVVDLKPIAENWGVSIEDTFEILKAHIEEMRKPEHSGPKYWDDFEWLYHKSSQQAKG